MSNAHEFDAKSQPKPEVDTKVNIWRPHTSTARPGGCTLILSPSPIVQTYDPVRLDQLLHYLVPSEDQLGMMLRFRTAHELKHTTSTTDPTLMKSHKRMAQYTLPSITPLCMTAVEQVTNEGVQHGMAAFTAWRAEALQRHMTADAAWLEAKRDELFKVHEKTIVLDRPNDCLPAAADWQSVCRLIKNGRHNCLQTILISDALDLELRESVDTLVLPAAAFDLLDSKEWCKNWLPAGFAFSKDDATWFKTQQACLVIDRRSPSFLPH